MIFVINGDLKKNMIDKKLKRVRLWQKETHKLIDIEPIKYISHRELKKEERYKHIKESLKLYIYTK